MPLGDWGSFTTVAVGALADVQYGVSPELEVTGRGGFLFHFEKHNVRLWELPLFGGVKYGFGQRGERPYVAAELGFTNLHESTEWTNPYTGKMEKGSDSELDLSMTVGGGYELERLDFRGAIYIVDVGHAGNTMGLLASVGYAFMEF